MDLEAFINWSPDYYDDKKFRDTIFKPDESIPSNLIQTHKQYMQMLCKMFHIIRTISTHSGIDKIDYVEKKVFIFASNFFSLTF